jgi:1-acyl-sn-glycerol-3-phosphate acyltransferase
MVNLYRLTITRIVKLRYRLIRRIRFKIVRLTVFAFFRLWIKEIRGIENIPIKKPAIFISNHMSYFDFLILGAMLKNYVTFVASKKIKQTFFIKWFTKLHNVVYIDQDYPGYSFFRDIMRHLKAGKAIIIYPEATRSRSGKMLMPKYGFVKLAILADVPIIPITMKGTYEILPPDSRIPRLKKCTVIIGKKILISSNHHLLKNIYASERRKNINVDQLTKNDLQKIALQIMNTIRITAGEEWDASAINDIKKFEKESGLRNIKDETGKIGLLV